MTYQLVGGKFPIYRTEEGQIIIVKMLTKGLRLQDLPSISQIAVPKEVPETEHHLAHLTVNPKLQAKGDLSIMALYSILRSREYTKPWKVK